MTQEELDALMSGDVDLDEAQDELAEEESGETGSTPEEEEGTDDHVADEYTVSASKNWPPPPPTDDHKMVHQLDDVTKESEEKASEIFDHIEKISDEGAK